MFHNLLRKLKEKAKTTVLTPEPWYGGVPGYDKADGEVVQRLEVG